MKITSRTLIEDEMSCHGETFNDVEHCSIPYDSLDKDAYNCSWCNMPEPFLLWTKTRIYFSKGENLAAECGECESELRCDSVPRNPQDMKESDLGW